MVFDWSGKIVACGCKGKKSEFTSEKSEKGRGDAGKKIS